MKEGFVKTQAIPEVLIHYVEAYVDPDAPVVILLHGFPEFWYAWNDYLEPLSLSGFHPVAIDLRGYNKSSKPEGIEQYDLDLLVKDIKAVVDKFGKKAFLVGHDWGGIITWEFATQHPKSCEGIIVLNAPHRSTWYDNLNIKQIFKSWYTVFFQLPQVPELLIKRGNYQVIEDIFLRQSSNFQAYTEEDLIEYKNALKQPKALNSALNYYRANMKKFGKRAEGRINCPTLLIWGEKDATLEKKMVSNIDDYVVPQVIKRFYPESSHWIHREIPSEMVRVFVDFFQSVKN